MFCGYSYEGGPSIFMYKLFICHQHKTNTISKYHIIIHQSVKIIFVIKIDDWATGNIHFTVHVLYYLYKPGALKFI